MGQLSQNHKPRVRGVAERVLIARKHIRRSQTLRTTEANLKAVVRSPAEPSIPASSLGSGCRGIGREPGGICLSCLNAGCWAERNRVQIALCCTCLPWHVSCTRRLPFILVSSKLVSEPPWKQRQDLFGVNHWSVCCMKTFFSSIIILHGCIALDGGLLLSKPRPSCVPTIHLPTVIEIHCFGTML